MMKKIDGIFQHFTSEEKVFVEKIIGICQEVEESYSYHLSSFLNPREVEILQSIAAHFHLNTYSSQQILATEFVRVIIAPDYYVLDESDFDILALEICFPKKFHSLSHSQVLGTLLNQLGIRRDFIGDILIGDEGVFVILEKRFGDLARATISKISRVPVTWKEQALSTLPVENNKDFKSMHLLLSSLRLDKLVGAGFKMSRSNAVKLIESGQVKVNYKEMKQAGKLLEIGQLVSVRGFGRLKLRELLGHSKQGKLKVEIEVIKK
ncbi:S4-like domain-containing protein [Streptococcus varani]|uniref:S4-like domain-containing protein n=1 Tax=Streptococcus varani TaxID=1608583 RepID=A0A0E4CT44_9STRE|nr:YlmH/Sll1252 family protein [Streptococcus varani]CQR25285.1 S4-like domain-containing protein [Streptococcus varani]